MWELVLRNKYTIIVGILFTLVIGYILWLNNTITELTEKIKIKDGLIAEYVYKIDTQNYWIKELNRIGIEREAKAHKQLEIVRRTVELNKSKAAKILDVKPSNPADLCRSAEDLINQELSK